MPNLDCEHNLNSLTVLVDPTLDPNFLNKLYDSTFYDDWDLGPYSIEFYYQGSAVEFGKWYFPGTMVIESINGFEPASASFEIWDVHPNHFNLPFLPIGQMVVMIWNRNKTECYYRGRVQDVQIVRINRRTDGTQNRRFKVSCLDLKIDFKRWLVTESYTNTTTYAIMKDLVKNWTPFDESLIDATKGFVLTEYKIQLRYPAEVIQELLDLEVSSTISLDPETLKVTIDEVTAPTVNFLTVTEANFADYFLPNEFNVSPQSLILRNRVIFWFNGAYTTGTVACTNGGRTLIGTGTSWKSVVRSNDGKILLEGDATTYSIDLINSNTDILLTSTVNRTTATGLSYSAFGYRDCVVVDDSSSIATLAAILGESFEKAGVFEVKMPERSGPMNREQARVFAQAYVNRMVSNIILRGKAKTKNYKVNTANIRGGWTITVDLEDITGTIVLQKQTLTDKHGGAVDRISDPFKGWYDGIRYDPIHDMDWDFTDRRLLQDAVMERTLQDIREVQIADDSILQAIRTARELILIGDCADVVYGVGPNGIDSPEETLTIEETCTFQYVTPGGSFYASPVSGGQTPGYCLDDTHYAFAA